MSVAGSGFAVVPDVFVLDQFTLFEQEGSFDLSFAFFIGEGLSDDMFHFRVLQPFIEPVGVSADGAGPYREHGFSVFGVQSKWGECLARSIWP